MRVMVGVAIAVALTACDQGELKPDCTGAAAAIAKANEDGKKHVAKVCTDDKWTRAGASCFAKAKDAGAINDCRTKHLTGTQLEHLDELWFKEAMQAMTMFKDRMCLCKDVDCAKKVSDDMTKWSLEKAKEQPNPAPKLTDADTRLATQIGTQMGECMQKAMGYTPPTYENPHAGEGNANVP